MIHIIDYGLGNIQAFLTTYKRLGIDAASARSANDLKGANKLILPGVGAFDHAVELLDASGMREPLELLVRDDKVPVLGVCVGMQIRLEVPFAAVQARGDIVLRKGYVGHEHTRRSRNFVAGEYSRSIRKRGEQHEHHALRE